MTVSGLATVLSWLDDVLPGRADRRMPPKFADEASRNAMASFPGQTLFTWLALREHGVSYAQAAAMVPHPDDKDKLPAEAAERKTLEHFRLLDVFRDRRRTRVLSGEPGGDVAETWCADQMARLVAEYGIAEVGNLTLDQFEFLASAGKADEQWSADELQAIVDEWRANTLPMVKAAMEAGQIEEVQSLIL